MRADAAGDHGSARAAVWSRHWASGSPHSCAGSYGDTYGGAIAAFWREVLQSTPAGAHALDLASGSGALPRLFAQLRPQHLGAIDAVDLTPTAPPWFDTPAAAAVRFHGGVSIETLPFADASFDLVVSQWGLEYAGPQAWAEARRVLAPGGCIALVLHHAQSRPVQLAASEITHIEWLRSACGLLPAALAMIEPLTRAATPQGRAALAANPAAQACRQRFNRAQAALDERISAQPDGADLLFEVREAVMQALTPARQDADGETASRALAQLDQQLVDAHWRLRELRDCALDGNGLNALAAALASPRAVPVVGTLDEGGLLMGWTLQVACG